MDGPYQGVTPSPLYMISNKSNDLKICHLSGNGTGNPYSFDDIKVSPQILVPLPGSAYVIYGWTIGPYV